MKSEEDIKNKIASTIGIRDKLKPQLIDAKAKLEAEKDQEKLTIISGEYQTHATQMVFHCELLSGLYFALGHSNAEIKEIISDPDYSGLFPTE